MVVAICRCVEFLGFPFIDPFEDGLRVAAEAAAALAAPKDPSGGSKESTPGEGGATKPHKGGKKKTVIKVHQVKVDEIPEVGSCPDPYY